MTNHAEITAPFADGEKAFRISIDQWREFERTRDKSLMGTYTAMVTKRAGFVDDVRELIRLELIGAGMPAGEALQLVRSYVNGQPLAETFPLALQIAEAAIYGNPAYQEARAAKDG